MGKSFPEFVAGFAPAARLAYLPDLARLEQAWLRALPFGRGPAARGADVARLAPDDLLEARLSLHPATRLGRIRIRDRLDLVRPSERRGETGRNLAS